MSRELPEGWHSAQLGDVIKLEYGKALASTARSSGTVPVYGSSGIVGYHSQAMVEGPSIVISRKGSLGGVFFTEQDFWPIDTTYYVVRREQCNWQWLTYLLKSASLERLNEATGVPGLNRDKASQENILIPTLPEQRRIAEILSSVDDAIAATQAVIEQTKKVKQATRERLLTRGIGHTHFKQTKYGGYPESWKTLQLQEVALVRTGLAKNKKEIVDTVELPYLRVANVQDGYIDLSDLRTINVSRSQIERYRLMQGDVLMTEGGDYDKLGRGDVWDGAVDPCLHQNHVFAVRTDQTKIFPEFLALLTASKAGKAYFQSCSKQTTNLASINSTQVKEFPVRLPNLAEQYEILASISIQQELIKSMEVDVNIKKKLKLALMSDLLTGRKRVTDTLPLAAE